MAIFVPSEKNLRALKNLLMEDFEMASAHASEAIAALMGFKSHFAFRHSGIANNGQFVGGADFRRFIARCSHMGYDQTSSEWLPFAFKQATWPDPAWRLFKKRDIAGQNRWFQECKQRNIPYIAIIRSTKYCRVTWDHISTQQGYDEALRLALGSDHHTQMFRLFQLTVSELSRKPFFEGNAFVGDVIKLAESDARCLADIYAQLLYPKNLALQIEAAA